MRIIFIYCLSLLFFYSLKSNAQDSSSKVLNSIVVHKEQILYFEGKHCTLTKGDLPFLYVTFSDSNKVHCLIGYYPFKVHFYMMCSYFDLKKDEFDSLYIGYKRYTMFNLNHKNDYKKIELYKKEDKWYCKIEDDDRLLILEPYLPTIENETRRKLIYYEAMENYEDYYLYSNFGWKQFRSSIVHVSVDTTLLQLPYKEYCNVINNNVALKIEEIEKSKSFLLPRTFYLYENDTRHYIAKGKIFDNQKFFDLLKQAKPIEKPESFHPLYSIMIDYPARGKNVRLGRMKYEYLFNNRIFTLYGYWFQFDRDILDELKSLCIP
jgi:hypothetical protein